MAQMFCRQHVLKPILYFSTSYSDNQNSQIAKGSDQYLNKGASPSSHPQPPACEPAVEI